MFWVFHGDIVNGVSEFSLHREAVPVFGDAGIDYQAFELGADAQNPLRNGPVCPGGGAGKPGVFGLAVGGRVFAGDHLGEDIGFAAV